jgi:serine/threonine-protein kinase RsbW
LVSRATTPTLICVTAPGLRRIEVVDRRLCIQFDSDNTGLEAGRRIVNDFLRDNGAGARGVYQVELAFEELVTNVIRYAYRDRQGAHAINASLRVRGDVIVLTIEDDGLPFNPLEAPDPALPSSIEDAKVGGLGIKLLRKTAREIAYERLPGGNRVTVSIENA